MATNVVVRDLDNYPDNSRTVTVDLVSLIPVGTKGDEEWAITVYTSARADGGTEIQDVFVRKNCLGYSRSTGFNPGPYTITGGSQDQFGISINGSAVCQVELTPSATALTGAAVAADMQEKIRDLAKPAAAEAGNLAFSNAAVCFIDGSFFVKSGVLTDQYVGSNKSSVRITKGSENDVAAHLGFLGAIESEVIASRHIKETYVAATYTTGTTLEVADGSIFSEGDYIAVTDGIDTSKEEVVSINTNELTLSGSLSEGYAVMSRVQILEMQDPYTVPTSVLGSVDDTVRYALYTIIDQIDFS